MIINDWFIERFKNDGGAFSFKVSEFLFEGKSEYQSVKVLKNSLFGNVMLLDDLVMLTEKEEFFYHDMLIHVAMVCVSKPEQVLIIGGGDGGSVREALKHKGVKRVVLCEIDKMVIDVSREFFPEVACKLDDKRVEIVVGDGIEYVKNHKNEFDCIFVDSTDPIGPATGLFTTEFYSDIRDALKTGGAMSVQSETPAWLTKETSSIRKNIEKAFGNAYLYLCPIPCYPSGLWSFTMAFKSDKNPAVDFDEKRSVDVARTSKYYNADIHRAAFALPNFIRKAL